MKQFIIVGSLNTDLIIENSNKLNGPGEYAVAESLSVAPGGKSRNIAQMIAVLRGTGQGIHFIGTTIKDKFGFWKYPIDSLQDLDIDTQHIHIEEANGDQLPGLAFIPVDKSGQNQIYIVPGASNNLSDQDILRSQNLFTPDKILVLTLEMPAAAAKQTIELANQNKLKSFIDPGGIEGRPDLIEIIKMGGFLLKPNEHEAQLLTNITITNFESAKNAGKNLLNLGYKHVVITHGSQGAYLISLDNQAHHFKAPDIDASNGNSVGCGDQTLAAIAHFHSQGHEIKDSVRLGTIAGSLEFTKKAGIIPITSQEIKKFDNSQI